MTETIMAEGLEGVIAGRTAISSVAQDGLWYWGYSIEELARQSTFEEVAYLMLNGELPDEKQLLHFSERMFLARAEAEPALRLLPEIPKDAILMDVLRTCVSLLAHHDPQTSDNSHEANISKSERLMGQAAEIVPAWFRVIDGKQPVPPRPGLSHAGQILYQLHGDEPDPVAVETLDMTLILYAEHEYNASTFAARTTVSTLSDMHSAIVSAIGTLKGPLHGGANEKAMDIFEELESPDHAESWLRERLEKRERVMGFGHRVYKNGDHRAVVLGEKAKELAKTHTDRDWAGIYDVLVNTVLNEKGLHPNVDFPCGLAYLLLGLPRDICTPLFVASRLSGWCAHVTEQLDNNRLIRPLSEYIGPDPRPYVPMVER